MRNADDKSAPGKYDVIWGNGVTSPAPKAGVPFSKALTRSASASGQLGHGAPAAVLLPEECRHPGVVVCPDRSCAKDSVRRRATHVRDFSTEASRPDYTVGAREYHDKSDPAVCA